MQITWNKRSDEIFVADQNKFYRILDSDVELFSEIGECGPMTIYFGNNDGKVYVSLRGERGEFIGWVYSLNSRMCNFHSKGGCPTFSCSDLDPGTDIPDLSNIPKCCQMH